MTTNTAHATSEPMLPGLNLKKFCRKTLQLGDTMHLIAVDQNGRAIDKARIDPDLRIFSARVLDHDAFQVSDRKSTICSGAEIVSVFMGKPLGFIAPVHRYGRTRATLYKLARIERHDSPNVKRLHE